MKRIDKNKVQQYLHITADKIKEWEHYFPMLDFDKFGRAKLCNIKPDLNELLRELRSSWASDSFVLAIEHWMDVNGTINRLPYYGSHYDIHYFMALFDTSELLCHNLVTVVKDNREKKMKLSKILSQIQEIWETEMETRYADIRREIKMRREQGETFSSSRPLQELHSEKKKLESGNLYVAHDQFLNQVKKTPELWLSVNPLDIITSSGDDADNPTKFSSCWSIQMIAHDDYIAAYSYGCHSSPSACMNIGKIMNRGILFTKNGNTLRVPNTDFDFLGYSERAHVWFDINPVGIFMEKNYPIKTDQRKQEFLNALESVGIHIIHEPSAVQRFNYIDYNGVENYIEKSSGNLFLDNVAIEDGLLYRLCGSRVDYEYGNNIDGIPLHCHCSECGCAIYSEDDSYTYYNDYFCHSCYHHLFTICDSCGEVIERDNAIYIEDYSYCEYHASRVGDQCYECGDWYFFEDLHAVDYRNYCSDCFNEEYTYCYNCGDAVSIEETEDVNGNDYCKYCREEMTA